ncbi:MAG: transferase [Flavobacteriaceae bacterium]|nr:MAG: transferase [Flavobacteriaceae bacterium]
MNLKKNNMKEIIIVGAGGSGMDVICIINSINKIKNEWKILGFLDDNSELLGEEIMGYRVLGNIEDGKEYSDAYFVSSIANPTNRIVRKQVFNRIKKYTNNFATIIHPSVIIYEDVDIGLGTVINAGCILGSKVRLGTNVHVGYGCNIAHETIINDNVSMGSGVNLSSGVIIGVNCYIGAGVSSTHDICVDENILVTVGSSIVTNLKRNIYDTWIGTPAISLKEFMRNKIVLKKQ